MQDFFKKQRLQTSIGEHKTKTWPEVQGGKDLQLIDLMSKRAALSTSGQRDDAPASTGTMASANENAEDPCPGVAEVNQIPMSQGGYYNQEWLEVNYQESQKPLNIPDYDAEGLIPGVDFPVEENAVEPLHCAANFRETPRYSKPNIPDKTFHQPEVEADEDPMPSSSPDPETPSVRWTGKENPLLKPPWSLRSGDVASCSSFTPGTPVSYRGSPTGSEDTPATWRKVPSLLPPRTAVKDATAPQSSQQMSAVPAPGQTPKPSARRVVICETPTPRPHPPPPSESRSPSSRSQVSKETTGTSVEHPTVMESRNLESFYQSAWVVELQRHHQRLLMEEIKAQIEFKPADRFSIMSAFEEADDDANFPARKYPSSRRPYRTFDEELQVYFSYSDTTASKESGRSTELNWSSATSSVGEFHDRRNSDRSARESSVSSTEQRPDWDSLRRLRQSSAACGAEPAPPRSRPEPMEDHVPMDFQETRKVVEVKSQFTPGGGQGDIPIKHESKESTDGMQLVEEESHGTPLLDNESTAITNGGRPQTAGLDELQSAAASCKPAAVTCRCDVPKADKACQAQPQVATVGTMCDDV
ncbi:uncharacterized protein LOC144159392 isoform X4 [Haemaphysalis longicornis]